MVMHLGLGARDDRLDEGEPPRLEEALGAAGALLVVALAAVPRLQHAVDLVHDDVGQDPEAVAKLPLGLGLAGVR